MASTELNGFIGHWLPRVEAEMRATLAQDEAALRGHYGMMTYHLGWLDEGLRPAIAPAGKRLRPIFLFARLCRGRGDPVQALPAAAAIELLHNFSLIHDDIEDGDETRRHRATVWRLWGVPQAINAGDGLFALAYAALLGLSRRGLAAEVTLAALDHFTQTTIALTEGQHLDMGFEQRASVTVAEYLRMIEGKTAALVGCSLAIGGLIGGATTVQQQALRAFGQAVGLAFQIQDDILGIWGDPVETGKPAGNDLLRRKKSLPILHALNHAQAGEEFAATLANLRYADDLPPALALLAQAETRAYAEGQVRSQHAAAVAALHTALGERASDSTLMALADSLVARRS